jgi:hypothetical protein
MKRISSRLLRAIAPLFLAVLPLAMLAAPAAAETLQVSYAQLLVDFAVYNNPGVVAAEIHLVVPGEDESTMLATSHGTAGGRTGAEILQVVKANTPTMKNVPASAPGPYTGKERRRLLLPLRTADGTTIGALSLLMAPKAGQTDETVMHKAADIRNRLQELTPKVATMFDPYTKGYSASDTLAQRINQILLARHPDVNVIALHLTKPGDKTNKVWGINRPNFLQRDSDEIDTDTEKTGRIVMQVIPATHRMEVHMPLLSPDGAIIGTLCTVYFWHDMREASELYARSLGIMEEARLLTTNNRDDLFKP